MLKREALCIDDDPDTCRVAVDVLQEMGYHVHVAHTRDQAMRFAADARPELVFLSMEIDDDSPIQLFEAIQQFHPNVLGILLTSTPSGPAILSANRSGIHQILIKPIDETDLVMMFDESCIAA